MNRPRKFSGGNFFLQAAIFGIATWALAPNAFAADATVTNILSGLKAPCAVSVRPEGGQPSEVFVAERGAGRIVRVVTNRPDAAEDVITGFPSKGSSASKPNSLGIQSLCFLDHLRLVVAGGDDTGKPFFRLYELQNITGRLKFDDQKQNVELSDDELTKDEIRSFHDLARARSNDRVADMLLMGATNEHGPAGLWKLNLRANTLGEIAPFDTATESEKAAAIGGIAVAGTGYIVVATGEEGGSDAGDVLRFLNPVDRTVALRAPTDLQNIVGLAYDPTTGDLYAANAKASDPSAAGVYRLDDAGVPGKPRCQGSKIAAVSRPTALAFGPDGVLYVTSLGKPGESDDSGALLKIVREQ